MANVNDGWKAGSTYERFMGRWSRRLAPEFVAWMHIPPGSRWLDVGCGTGALTSAICEFGEPKSVKACDPAEPLVRYAREQIVDDRVSFSVAGAGTLPPDVDGYGSIASLFVLNFIPDPVAAIKEMRSLASPNGSISACVWDYTGKMEFLRHFWDSAIEEDPDAREQDEGVRFPICRPRELEMLFRSGGLSNVRCEAIEIATEFASFDDYWSPMLGGTGPAPSYVDSLPDDRREVLAQNVKSRLPTRADGSIHLTARAWAVQGLAG